MSNPNRSVGNINQPAGEQPVNTTRVFGGGSANRGGFGRNVGQSTQRVQKVVKELTEEDKNYVKAIYDILPEYIGIVLTKSRPNQQSKSYCEFAVREDNFVANPPVGDDGKPLWDSAQEMLLDALEILRDTDIYLLYSDIKLVFGGQNFYGSMYFINVTPEGNFHAVFEPTGQVTAFNPVGLTHRVPQSQLIRERIAKRQAQQPEQQAVKSDTSYAFKGFKRR